MTILYLFFSYLKSYPPFLAKNCTSLLRRDWRQHHWQHKLYHETVHSGTEGGGRVDVLVYRRLILLPSRKLGHSSPASSPSLSKSLTKSYQSLPSCSSSLSSLFSVLLLFFGGGLFELVSSSLLLFPLPFPFPFPLMLISSLSIFQPWFSSS
jgi:hypothetical protein